MSLSIRSIVTSSPLFSVLAVVALTIIYSLEEMFTFRTITLVLVYITSLSVIVANAFALHQNGEKLPFRKVLKLGLGRVLIRIWCICILLTISYYTIALLGGILLPVLLGSYGVIVLTIILAIMPFIPMPLFASQGEKDYYDALMLGQRSYGSSLPILLGGLVGFYALFFLGGMISTYWEQSVYIGIFLASVLFFIVQVKCISKALECKDKQKDQEEIEKSATTSDVPPLAASPAKD